MSGNGDMSDPVDAESEHDDDPGSLVAEMKPEVDK